MADKPFAFRMPDIMKDAAKALSKTSFSEWEDDGSRTVRNVNPSSINDALIYLVQSGARRACVMIDHDIKDSEGLYDFWKDVVQFFLDHPERDAVFASDFPDGSEMRQKMMDAGAGYEDLEDPTIIGRIDAMTHLSMAQDTVITRRRAKEALVSIAF